MSQWLLAWRNILRNRRRALVTMLITSVGCMSVLVAAGFALYTYEQLEDGSAREFGHITVASKDYFSRTEDTPMQHGMADHRALIHQLSANPHVRQSLARVSLSGLISNGDKSVPFFGHGVDVVAEAKTRGELLQLKAGTYPNPDDSATGPSIMLGVGLAENLNARPGSGLTLLATTTSGGINAVDVTVSGVVTTGWREADQRLVYMGLHAAQKLLMTESISTLAVYLDSLEATPEVLTQLSAADPDHSYKPWWTQAFYYESVRELYNRIFGLLGLIIAVLVFFSVANTLAMAVVERTREIGTLRALGALPQEVVGQFVREGTLIGLIGAVAGASAAGVVKFVLPYAGFQMPPPPGRTVGYPLLVNASVPLYFITMAAIIALCACAAWFVSRKAAQKSIVEALTHV